MGFKLGKRMFSIDGEVKIETSQNLSLTLRGICGVSPKGYKWSGMSVNGVMIMTAAYVEPGVHKLADITLDESNDQAKFLVALGIDVPDETEVNFIFVEKNSNGSSSQPVSANSIGDLVVKTTTIS